MKSREIFPDWRNSAEIPAISGCGFVMSETSRMVGLVAGPSNNMPVANCQNRYPSPSRRPDRTPVRSLESCGLRQSLAERAGGGANSFAFHCVSGASESINHTTKGYRACKRNSGRSHFRPCWVFRPAATQCLSRACLAPARALRRPPSQVAMPLPARLSGQAPTCFTARTIRASAETRLTAGAQGCPDENDKNNGQPAHARLAVSRLRAGVQMAMTLPEGEQA